MVLNKLLIWDLAIMICIHTHKVLKFFFRFSLNVFFYNFDKFLLFATFVAVEHVRYMVKLLIVLWINEFKDFLRVKVTTQVLVNMVKNSSTHDFYVTFILTIPEL